MQKKTLVDVLAALRGSSTGGVPNAAPDPLPSAASAQANISAIPTISPKSSASAIPASIFPASSTVAVAPAPKSLRIPDWLVHGLPKVDGAMWDKYRRVALGRGESPEALIAEAVMFYGDNFL